jgi:hypothetical protein
MNTVVILGAGCSMGLAGMPGDKDFFNHNPKKVENQTGVNIPVRLKGSIVLETVLKMLYDSKNTGTYSDFKQNRLEHCWNELQENINHSKIILTDQLDEALKKAEKYAVEELKKDYRYFAQYLFGPKILNSPYQYIYNLAEWEMRNLIVDVYKNPREKHIDKYKELSEKIREVTGDKSKDDLPTVISFNYDTLFESALGKEQYYYQHVNGESSHPNKNRMWPILKPHGSANWI